MSERFPLHMCVMPSTWDAKTPDEFASAAVFPRNRIEDYYRPYGPPIYEISSVRPDETLELLFSTDWLLRTLDDPYDVEPFELDVSPCGEPYSGRMGHSGSVSIQSGSREPLTQFNVASADFRLAVFDANKHRSDLRYRLWYRPIYSFLSYDYDSHVASIQLHPTWIELHAEVITEMLESGTRKLKS